MIVSTTLYTSHPFHLSTEYISPNLEGKKKMPISKLDFKCLFVQCLTIYKILSHISHLMIDKDYILHTREQN